MDCPNCGTPIKSGMFSSVSLLEQNEIDFINEYHHNKRDGYCSKCGKEMLTNYLQNYNVEKSSLIKKMSDLISALPVVSVQNPINWDYEILSMVTGQSTTGTGVISEFTSSFTDLLGRQSGRFNKKLKDGEALCFSQLRMQALDLGGNAVIATDIDYSEVGGDKGMLMVCMGGTAVKLKNIIILGEERANQINELHKMNARIRILNAYNK